MNSSYQSSALEGHQIGHEISSGSQNDKMDTARNVDTSPRNVGATTSDENKRQNRVNNQMTEITTDNNAAKEDSFFYGGGQGLTTNDREADSGGLNINDIPSIVDNETMQH